MNARLSAASERERGSTQARANLDQATSPAPDAVALPTRAAARAYGHREGGGGALAVAVVVATTVHLAFAWAIPAPAPAPASVVVMDAEILAVQAPAPPPVPAQSPVPPADLARPVARAPARAPSPPIARAGALLTARPEVSRSTANEPVDFVTDPNGRSYGGGTVMRGGTADLGARDAVEGGVAGAVAAAPHTPSGDGLTAPADLSRAARLVDPDACRGDYPGEAVVDLGSAVVSVVVRASGQVSRAVLISESPAGQGFGRAARACLQSRAFTPAFDKHGRAASSAATIHVRFSR